MTAGARGPGSPNEIQTVRGPIPLADLGWTLTHEHFFSHMADAPGMLLFDEEVAALELADAARAGTRSVVDLTTFDLGRDPAALRRLSERTGVNIVMATGWYLHRSYPDRIAFASTSSLADELIADIEHGVDGVRPGVIGEIGTFGLDIEAREERVLRAVARAHATTGLTIFVHQQRVYSAPGVLAILAEEGVQPEIRSSFATWIRSATPRRSMPLSRRGPGSITTASRAGTSSSSRARGRSTGGSSSSCEPGETGISTGSS